MGPWLPLMGTLKCPLKWIWGPVRAVLGYVGSTQGFDVVQQISDEGSLTRGPRSCEPSPMYFLFGGVKGLLKGHRFLLILNTPKPPIMKKAPKHRPLSLSLSLSLIYIYIHSRGLCYWVSGCIYHYGKGLIGWSW